LYRNTWRIFRTIYQTLCSRQFYLEAVRRLRDAVHRNDQERRSVGWKITTHPCTWPNLCSWCWPNTKFSRCVSHNSPLILLYANFLLFPVLSTLTGKAIEDEELSYVTPRRNLYRCTKRTNGCASNSGRASGINLSRQNGSGSEGISR
jgi:hypothetical protein